ncbi:hypothetical protein GCM10023147_29740 [Tsukamurella soli]|uniref:Uncharacterized protein n=1 Tax=Tsukamurella soli TaxID=644556 RepID=A0ABP8JTU7_9ACTN
MSRQGGLADPRHVQQDGLDPVELLGEWQQELETRPEAVEHQQGCVSGTSRLDRVPDSFAHDVEVTDSNLVGYVVTAGFTHSRHVPDLSAYDDSS